MNHIDAFDVFFQSEIILLDFINGMMCLFLVVLVPYTYTVHISVASTKSWFTSLYVSFLLKPYPTYLDYFLWINFLIYFLNFLFKPLHGCSFSFNKNSFIRHALDIFTIQLPSCFWCSCRIECIIAFIIFPCLLSGYTARWVSVLLCFLLFYSTRQR